MIQPLSIQALLLVSLEWLSRYPLKLLLLDETKTWCIQSILPVWLRHSIAATKMAKGTDRLAISTVWFGRSWWNNSKTDKMWSTSEMARAMWLNLASQNMSGAIRHRWLPTSSQSLLALSPYNLCEWYLCAVKLSNSEMKLLTELYQAHNVSWNVASMAYKNQFYLDIIWGIVWNKAGRWVPLKSIVWHSAHFITDSSDHAGFNSSPQPYVWSG